MLSEAIQSPETDEVSAACRKRSFLRLPADVDHARLWDEFQRIPADAWGVSHWDAHCSIDVLLLRGGHKGAADDFTTASVENNPVLEDFPYIASLLAPGGPFGGATYAFIFRTKPNGMTRVHTDDHPSWERNVRIHIPLVTNPEAVLLVEGRSKHLPVGEVWTFDNQSPHSVMNGGATRIHMIVDVPPNANLAQLMRAATFDPGEPDPERWALTCAANQVYVFARAEPLLAAQKRALGLPADGFAARVTSVTKKARYLLYSPLRVGDLVTHVDGADASHLCRTAVDYLFRSFKPGSVATLNVIRGGRRMQVKIKLVSPDHFALKARLRALLPSLGRRS